MNDMQKSFSLLTAIRDHHEGLLRKILFSIDEPRTLGRALLSFSGFYRDLKEGDAELLKRNVLFELTLQDTPDFEKTKRVKLIDKTGRPYAYVNYWFDQVVDYAPYKKGTIEGERKYFSKEGKLLCVTQYAKGKENGECKKWNEEGTLIHHSFYEEGKMNGVLREWHSNGQLRHQSFHEKGKRNGALEEWNKDGVMITQSFYTCSCDFRGVRQENLTSSKTWGDDGGLLSHIFYKDTGEKVKKLWFPGLLTRERKTVTLHGYILIDKDFYESGKIRRKSVYEGWGKINRTSAWDENGTLILLHIYKTNEDYYHTTWFASGQKRTEGRVFRGFYEGEYKEWYENGQIRVITYYSNGNAMWTSFWDSDGEIVTSSQVQLDS